MALGVLEHVGEPWVREDGRAVAGLLVVGLLGLRASRHLGRVLRPLGPRGHALAAGLGERHLVGGLACGRPSSEAVLAALGRLGAGDVEVLHRDAPALLGGVEPGDDAAPPRAGGEVGAGGGGVADGGGEADPPGVHARETREPLDAAQGLVPAVPTEQGVDLVDHDEAQVREDPPDRGVAVQEHGLERLRGYLEDSGGVLEHLGLVGLRDVPVPVPHGYVALGAEVLQAEELVVDQRLQGADVDAADRGGRVLPELGEDGEEGRLGLARGGRRGEKDVVVRVEDGVGGRDLHGTEALPVVVVDEVLDEGCVAVEGAHGAA